MMAFLESLLSGSNIYWTSFLFCFVSGLIPILNTEAYIMSVSTFASPDVIWPVTIISTAGQLFSKMIVYLTGRGTIRFPLKRYEDKVEQVKQKFEKWKSTPYLFVFISGLVGIPPFYAVSFFAGLIRMDYKRFFLAGFLGRLLRFTLAAQLPQLFMKIFKYHV